MASKGPFGRSGRPAPKGVGARLRYLFGRKADKDPKKAAGELGVTERTVKRWMSGKSKPNKANAEKIEKRTEAKYEDKARESAKAAGQPYLKGGGTDQGAGLSRMQFHGPVTMMGQSSRNYSRNRNITQPLTPDQAERAAAAYASGDSEALYQVAREVLRDYFNEGGGYSFTPEDLDFDLGSADFT